MIKSSTGIRQKIEYDKTIPISMEQRNNDEIVPVHYHNAFEVIMPTEGECNIAIGGVEYILKKQEILFITPGVIHSINPGGEGKYFMLHVNTALFREVPEADSLLQSFGSFVIYDEAMDQIAKALMNKRIDMLWAHYCSKEPYKYFHFYASVIVLFAIAGRANLEFDVNNIPIVSEQYSDKHKEILEIICRYIDHNYEKDMNAKSIAEMYGFSVSHFYRIFTAYTGITFSQYLTEQRIAAAKRILSTNKKDSIIEIATQAGFKSVSSFNRVFKQKTGHTPTEYRDAHKESEL